MSFKEIIKLDSNIDKRITNDSQIIKLLNYSSSIETIFSQTSIITKVIKILSPLNNEE
jgi:hypothetical protein